MRWAFRFPRNRAALLQPVAAPVLELVRRFARTHGPFTLRESPPALRWMRRR
jgi:hypothetical protein